MRLTENGQRTIGIPLEADIVIDHSSLDEDKFVLFFSIRSGQEYVSNYPADMSDNAIKSILSAAKEMVAACTETSVEGWTARVSTGLIVVERVKQ